MLNNNCSKTSDLCEIDCPHLVHSHCGKATAEIPADCSSIEPIDNFLQHIHSHINQDPTTVDNTLKITIGGKTLVTYDHAALVQGLIDALEYLKEEI